MSWEYRDGHYISDGSLFYVNYQSEREHNYALADAGVRVVFLYNGSGPIYYCAANPGTQEFNFSVWHTTSIGGEPEYEGSPPQIVMNYKGHDVRYADNQWHSPTPILAPGVEVHPYSGNLQERRETALYWLFHYVYDKYSFLTGLAVGRALWKPPSGGVT